MNFNQVLLYLQAVIKYRMDLEFGNTPEEPQPFSFSADSSELINFCLQHQLSADEIVVLFLALVPHIIPDFFSKVIGEYLPNGGDFPEFGGVKGRNHRGILPTGETALYILAGRAPDQRAGLYRLFSEDHFFALNEVLFLEDMPPGEPRMSGKLILAQEYIELFTTGLISKPKLSSDFPAQLIETDLEWTDLILNEKTSQQIAEIETWINHNAMLMGDWGMKSRIKPGFRVLFAGPSGTGKTLTASLLGKYTNRDVYRIDLSLVISKYIGETEKNLSKLFDRARNKNWLLFFDEADAIFGKRTSIRDAHDKYANQEVSYLLQRIESHDGLVILASNLKNNIDSAFTRRFNSIVEFETPSVAERLMLWKNNIPEKVLLDDKIVMKEIARKYELNGANIVNVIHYACLKTLENNSTTISYSDLIKGIQKEYIKEGKMINLEE